MCLEDPTTPGLAVGLALLVVGLGIYETRGGELLLPVARQRLGDF